MINEITFHYVSLTDQKGTLCWQQQRILSEINEARWIVFQLHKFSSTDEKI